MSRERLFELDFVRAAAALAVVLIHSAESATGHSGFLRLGNEVLRLAVPAFFFLSGAVVWARPGGGRSRRRYAAILVPYVAWSALYAVLRVQRWGGGELPRDFGAFAVLGREILTGRVWYHLYFVPVLVALYLLAPLARVLAARRAWLPLALSAGLAGAWGVLPLPHALPADVARLLTDVVRYAPFAAAGMWYARARAVALPRIVAAAPALLGIGVAVRLLQVTAILPEWPALRLVSVAAGLAVVAGLLGVGRSFAGSPSSAAIGTVARHSYIVYLAHPAALALLHRFVLVNGSAASWTDTWMVGVKFAYAIAAALFVAVLVERGRQRRTA